MDYDSARETVFPRTTTVKVENLQDLCKITHKCSQTEAITNLRIDGVRTSESLIHIEAYFQELTARFEEQSKSLEAFMSDSANRVRVLEVAAGQHNCKSELKIVEVMKDVAEIKLEIARFNGESKWHDRLWDIFKGLGIMAIGAMLLYFMKGGTIT